MYKVYVPVMIRDDFPAEETFREIRRSGCDGVFLSSGRHWKETPEGRRIDGKRYADLFRQEVKRYRDAGYTAGIWLGETMGHGGEDRAHRYAYQPFVSLKDECTCGFCCADERFRHDVCEWAATAAEAGAEIILLDDDWRMHSHGMDFNAGCLCPSHVKRFCEAVGEDLSAEEIKKKVFTGGGSRYRDAWTELIGSDMLRLAREIRETVDKIDPEIRIGLCVAPSVIDMDGAGIIALCDALAGGTRPFVRLIGAPYWAKNGADLAAVITSERMTAKWLEDWKDRTGAEVLFEGDVFPRPRFACSAAYLEAADQAARADGHFTGILKYMMDYGSSPRYEHGYIDKHVKNRRISSQIEKMFRGKRNTGFRPFEYHDIFRNLELPSDYLKGDAKAYDYFRGLTPRYLTGASAPVSFDSGVPVVFGENAKYVKETDIEKGAVIDAEAARILSGRGFDVGVTVENAVSRDGVMYADIGGGGEYHRIYRDKTICQGGTFATLSLSGKAEVLSEFEDGRPSAVRYENGRGQRFVIYSIVANSVDQSTFFRSYLRQREMRDIYRWISGEELPVSMTGHPDVLVICGEDGNETAAGFWNLFPDSIDRPVVKLGFVPGSVRFIGCSGRVRGKEVILDEMAPFSFAGLVIKR
ncbi:MAG: hypothetical protein IJU57_00295 [Clostridia bacterium]|nr:hypothetical protein [Clostridia bacterium]